MTKSLDCLDVLFEFFLFLCVVGVELNLDFVS